MANNPSTLPDYNGQINPPDLDYPYGSARDDASPGDLTGTPRVAAELKDLQGFQQALLSEAAVVPSGAPDTVQTSQYMQSLKKLFAVRLPTTEALLTDDRKDVKVYATDYYGAAALNNSGAMFYATGNNVPGSAGTFDRVNGLIYNATGDEFKIQMPKLYAGMFGVTTSDVTHLGAFLEYTWTNRLSAFILPGTYTVSAAILSLATSCSAVLICESDEAIFNYTGGELSALIVATEATAVQLMNLRFNCNDLVAAPIDIRRTTGSGGVVGLFGCRSFSVKQVGAVTTNPTGLQIIGNYAQCDFVNCEVDGVTHTDPARSSTGIGLSQFGGVASVRGCIVKNITTPTDADADGLKIFGTDVVTPTTFLGAKAEVHNNVFQNCEGRFMKFQISEAEVHGNQLKLDNGFSTITEWRAIDMQSNNGHIHDNAILLGSGITWGSAATLFTLQNIRNDGNAKTSYVHHNRISVATPGLNYMATCGAEFGRSSFIVEHNEVLGETIKRGIQFRALGGAASIDHASVIYRHNTVEDYSSQDMINLFDLEDFGAKLYLELIDNKVLNQASISRIHGAIGAFELDQFKIANNVNTANRIDWPFDMDDLPGGCAFNTGAQAVANKGTGITNFFFVLTDHYVQRNLNTAGTTEVRRTSLDGSTWNAWV